MGFALLSYILKKFKIQILHSNLSLESSACVESAPASRLYFHSKWL